MASNTTLIRGSALNNKCKMQAAYLSQLIYKDSPGKEPFKTCYPDEIKAAGLVAKFKFDAFTPLKA